MTTYRVVWLARAQAMADNARMRLREGRLAELLGQEIEKAVGQLARFPRLGTSVSTLPAVRKLLLRRTQHHIYYVIDEKRRQVQIVAIWHTARGSRPPL